MSEMIAFLGYALLGAAVYKLFRFGKELQEIKELLQKLARSSSGAAASASAAPATLPAIAASDPADDDSAAEYAANLLRSLQAESARGEGKPHKTV